MSKPRFTLSPTQDEFWSEALPFLRVSIPILARVNKLRSPERERFWSGDIDGKILAGLDVPNAPERIVAHCRARKSQVRAHGKLILEARREKLDSEGRVFANAGTPYLHRIDKTTHVVNLARTRRLKKLTGYDENTLKRIGRALTKEPMPRFDWGRVDRLDAFLVRNWCGDLNDLGELPPVDGGIPSFPVPLCLCTQYVLAYSCYFAGLTPEPEDIGASIAQRAGRLGLKRCADRETKRIKGLAWEGKQYRFLPVSRGLEWAA